MRSDGREDAVAPGAELARFHALRGFPVRAGAGAWWVRLGRFSWWRLPLTAEVTSSPEALDDLLRVARLPCLRYLARGEGAESGAYRCDPRGYSLARVERARRKKVRRGLDAAAFRAIEPAELLAGAGAANAETMARHRTFDPELGTGSGWRRFVRAVEACRGFELAGAFVGGRLASYQVAWLEDGVLHLLHRATTDAALARHVSAALDFWILSRAAEDPAVTLVVNGTYRPSLDSYKRSVGFELAPLGRVARVHPAARGLLASPWSARAAAAAERLAPRSAYVTAVAELVKAAR